MCCVVHSAVRLKAKAFVHGIDSVACQKSWRLHASRHICACMCVLLPCHVAGYTFAAGDCGTLGCLCVCSMELELT